MSEKIENSSSESSTEQKEKKINQRMLECQFEYADKLRKREIKFLNGENVDIDGFESIIRNYTRIPIKVRQAYRSRTGKGAGGLENDAEYLDVLGRVVAEICGQYEADHDFKILSLKSPEIISDIVDALPQSEKQREDMGAGVLGYEISRPSGEIAEKFDVDPLKDCIDIHFASLFVQQGQKGKEHLTRESLPEETKKSCIELAQIIREKYPDVAGVICTSWLLDTDWFAGALGFEADKSILANGTGFTKGNGFWGQFISKTGEIKESWIEDLLAGQEPKHRAKSNFISKEEFLRMHSK